MLRPIILWYAQNSTWDQNSFFLNAMSIFPNSFSLISDQNSKKLNKILFIKLSLNCDKPINSLYFQQWNWNFYIALLNPSLELGFLNVDFRLYFKLFPNSQKYWKLAFANVALVGLLNFSQFRKEMDYWNLWMLA